MTHTISVILPMHRWYDRTEEAILSMTTQQGVEIELLLVINGGAPDLADRVQQAVPTGVTARILRQNHASLPAALNLGLREATHPIVARMDADDVSHPGRLFAQAEHLEHHPDLAGCGCAAAFIGPEGSTTHIVTPPCRPSEARWRLLVSNAFVHGTMMLRRDAALDAGGYDERHDRAQDYGLWLRLADRGLGGIPDVLYTYHAGAEEFDTRQSDLTASFLLDAWAALPEGEPADVQPLMSRLIRGDRAARAELEEHMERQGPTRLALQTWMWSCWQLPVAKTDSQLRTRRIRLAADHLRDGGVESVWLWGAGDLARTIAASGLLGVEITGVVDDARVGADLAGHAVQPPAELKPGHVVLIASDAYEQAIWDRSAEARARGVRVLRLPVAT